MDDAELIARLRNVDGWFFEDPCDHIVYVSDDPLEAADRIETLTAENERLREALREVFEQWAGSEGFIPETAPEGYLLELTKRMALTARAALKQGEQ